MREALKNNAWILKIKPPDIVTVHHIREFFTLWMLVQDFHLDEFAEDDIVWKHSLDGIYSAATAYKAQFLSLTLSPMDFMVWKVWAPPKVIFFAWLALQDRIWTADRLAKRGWPNCDVCPLCKRVQECGPHLFYKCRYTRRLWSLVIGKFPMLGLDTSAWPLFETVEDWWASTCV